MTCWENGVKKVFGIDINGESLKASYGKGHKVIEASAVNLPFRSGSFGTVISINVIEHLAVEDAFKMLCEILRVLKPGGIFILKTELATDKFWNTFSHIRPYPPSSIIKMINENSEETFSKICDYKHVATIYEADIKEASLSGHIRNVLCQFIPLLRRSYIMILGKET